MNKLPIALVVITLNEERNIARCLQSVPLASDIVVLDSGSNDRTVEIARSLGARIFVEKWRGYGEQKKRAAELANRDWILSLDADEALSPELAQELSELGEFNQWDGFAMPRLSYHLGRWIHHGGWYPDWQVRLFHRGRAQWQSAPIHERVSAGKVKRLKNNIHHFPFGSLEKQVETNNEYSTLSAKELFDRGQKPSMWKLLTKPVSKFVETYLVKQGFRDGLPGFIISAGAAYSIFLKYAKLAELHRRTKS